MKDCVYLFKALGRCRDRIGVCWSACRRVADELGEWVVVLVESDLTGVCKRWSVLFNVRCL